MRMKWVFINCGLIKLHFWGRNYFLWPFNNGEYFDFLPLLDSNWRFNGGWKFIYLPLQLVVSFVQLAVLYVVTTVTEIGCEVDIHWKVGVGGWTMCRLWFIGLLSDFFRWHLEIWSWWVTMTIDYASVEFIGCIWFVIIFSVIDLICGYGAGAGE